MSQEAEIFFDLERERRRELYLERVRTSTQGFCLRYRQQYQDMCSQGYKNYIPEELERLKSDLDSIDSLLYSDPTQARQISQEVGSYIRSLWSLGREAQQTFREAARVAREKAKLALAAQRDEALSRYYAAISGWDEITANFAAEELTKLKEAIAAGAVTALPDVDVRLSSVLSAAQTQAAQWKEQKRQEQARQTVIEQIEEQKEAVKAERFEDNSKVQALLNTLEDIKRGVSANSLSPAAAQDKIQAVEDDTDTFLVGEEVRREMVKAIYKWFREHDFSVSKPKLTDDGDVKLTAQTPSGHKAQFKLSLNNKMFYRLDGYEGTGCLKDISAAKADWESVYGIKLSDEIVTWQNPDRILRQHNRTASDIGGNMQ